MEAPGTAETLSVTLPDTSIYIELILNGGYLEFRWLEILTQGRQEYNF